MAIMLGLDTGGTFTDAALVDTTKNHVVGKAKSLTTRADLAIGVGDAMAQALTAFDGDAKDVSLVCLSTTLATNAVVEGVGGRVGLVFIGFDDDILSRGGLAQAVGQDPVLHLAGGHRPDGGQQAPLDVRRLQVSAEELAPHVSAFAVASHFATRNPAHEKQAKEILRELTGLPVTCSHELSSSLGGPRRALTAMLNARLIGLLEKLVAATQARMDSLGLTCPLMVVKGDGSLLEADFARSRPVETVLSGPAASLAGAAFLAGTKTALVSDIGGTTTDIALLHNGTPRLSDDGANVGGWRTMVEAAHIRTSGLGGDSEVRPVSRGRAGGLHLGPRRAIPLSLLAQDWPELKTHLKTQLDAPIAQATDARFVVPVFADGIPTWLTRSEAKLAELISQTGPAPVAEIAATQVALGAVDRLIGRGLISLCSFTPTDAAHVTGSFTSFDSEAAELGARLMARQKTGLGEALASEALDIAQLTLAELARQSAMRIMDAALAEDGHGENSFSSSPLLSARLTAGDNEAELVSMQTSLSVPLIALGASAATHYPAIAKLLKADLIVPENADVAGAVGAAAGSVRQRIMLVITQPSDGTFRLHLPAGPKDFSTQDSALATGQQAAREIAEDRARAAGAKQVDSTVSHTIKEVELGGGKTLFVEAQIQAEATGI